MGSAGTVHDDAEDWTIASEGSRTTHRQEESGRLSDAEPAFSLGAQHVITRNVRENGLQHRVLRSARRERNWESQFLQGSRLP